MKIACVIPTLNGKHDLKRLLDSLKCQTLPLDILVVDSGSKDGTRELAEEQVNNVVTVSSFDFNHGGTRQLMIDLNPSYDIFIFMTQDAYLADFDSISKIIQPFSDINVAAVCGRQLPHFNANHFAKHARFFNYPESVNVRSIKNIPELGIKTAFMSNSFSAYRSKALKEVGGFPTDVILSEDMFIASKLLLAGWKLVYAGNAKCYHSHNYTITQEFKRYFDIGVFHTRESWIREYFGSAGGEGLRYVKSELRYLGMRFQLWPISIIRNLVKLLGYKLGQKEAILPKFIKRKLSMHKNYWDGPFAQCIKREKCI